MLTWRDAEEAAELMQRQANWESFPGPEHISAIEEYESEQIPLRRRLASALVQIGVRLDPTVVSELNPDEAA